MTIIALDVMSGDLGAQECVPAALLALSGDAELQLQLVGDAALIERTLAAAGCTPKKKQQKIIKN